MIYTSMELRERCEDWLVQQLTLKAAMLKLGIAPRQTGRGGQANAASIRALRAFEICFLNVARVWKYY